MNNYTAEQIEKMTIEFLRANDSDFSNKAKGNYSYKNEYPYLNRIPMTRRLRREISFSNLSKKDSFKCLKKGVEEQVLRDLEF